MKPDIIDYIQHILQIYESATKRAIYHHLYRYSYRAKFFKKFYFQIFFFHLLKSLFKSHLTADHFKKTTKKLKRNSFYFTFLYKLNFYFS